MSEVSRKVRDLCRLRDANMCQRCHGGKPCQELQHRRARGMGSAKREHTNCACNLLWLCRSCHVYIESHRTEAREMGWAISTHVEFPGLVPVNARGKTVTLSCDGRKVEIKG